VQAQAAADVAPCGIAGSTQALDQILGRRPCDPDCDCVAQTHRGQAAVAGIDGLRQ